jgi:hypothetical protein
VGIESRAATQRLAFTTAQRLGLPVTWCYATTMADLGLLDRAAVPVLQEIRKYNPLLFDFALKRLLRFEQYSFPTQVFETRRFFESVTSPKGTA